MTGPELIELRPTAMAAGGEAVAREPSGRVVFVRGALPGEAVVARMVEERDRYARAVVERVDDASPSRVEPPCPYVAAGCGGCSWQHIAPAEQRALKRQIATDALTRAGGVAGAVVVDGPGAAHRGLPHHRPAGGHRWPGGVPQAALARGRPRRRLPRRPSGPGLSHRRCPLPGCRRGGAALLRGDRRAAGPGPPRGRRGRRRSPARRPSRSGRVADRGGRRPAAARVGPLVLPDPARRRRRAGRHRGAGGRRRRRSGGRSWTPTRVSGCSPRACP